MSKIDLSSAVFYSDNKKPDLASAVFYSDLPKTPPQPPKLFTTDEVMQQDPNAGSLPRTVGDVAQAAVQVPAAIASNVVAPVWGIFKSLTAAGQDVNDYVVNKVTGSNKPYVSPADAYVQGKREATYTPTSETGQSVMDGISSVVNHTIGVPVDLAVTGLDKSAQLLGARPMSDNEREMTTDAVMTAATAGLGRFVPKAAAVAKGSAPLPSWLKSVPGVETGVDNARAGVTMAASDVTNTVKNEVGLARDAYDTHVAPVLASANENIVQPVLNSKVVSLAKEAAPYIAAMAVHGPLGVIETGVLKYGKKLLDSSGEHNDIARTAATTADAAAQKAALVAKYNNQLDLNKSADMSKFASDYNNQQIASVHAGKSLPTDAVGIAQQVNAAHAINDWVAFANTHLTDATPGDVAAHWSAYADRTGNSLLQQMDRPPTSQVPVPITPIDGIRQIDKGVKYVIGDAAPVPAPVAPPAPAPRGGKNRMPQITTLKGSK